MEKVGYCFKWSLCLEEGQKNKPFAFHIDVLLASRWGTCSSYFYEKFQENHLLWFIKSSFPLSCSWYGCKNYIYKSKIIYHQFFIYFRWFNLIYYRLIFSIVLLISLQILLVVRNKKDTNLLHLLHMLY